MVRMKLAAALFIATLTGCAPKLVKHPDAPMMTLETTCVKVAVENESGELVEFGTVKIPVGATIVVDYDWGQPPAE